MGKVSEKLNRAIEGFLQFAPGLSNHLERRDNPHEVTREQVGLGSVDNQKQATKAEFDAHKAAFSHPDGSVTAAKIANGAVGEEKLAVDAVTASRIYTGAVTTDKILNNAVTTEKIASGAVVSGKIGSSAVGSANIATSAVSTEKIASGAVTNAKIADGTISAGKLAAGSATDTAIGERAIQNPEYPSGTITNTLTNLFNAFTASIRSHFAGSGNRHEAKDVIYSGDLSVYDRINNLVLTGGSGTFDHSELSNRFAADQHSTKAITGLDNKLGVIFEGVTTTTAQTELLADPAKYANVTPEGRFIIKRGQATAFRLTILAARVVPGSFPTGQITNYVKGWEFEGVTSMVGTFPTVVAREPRITSMTGNEEGANVMLSTDKGNDGISELRINVTGPVMDAGFEMRWKAKLEVTMMDLYE